MKQFLRKINHKIRRTLLGPAKPRNTFFLNPHRIEGLKNKKGIKNRLQQKIVKVGVWAGFQNIEYTYVHGSIERVRLGKNCSTMNAIFNVISGNITVGDNTLFGHNCMVLTGLHKFFNGKRGSLHQPPMDETPSTGRDIKIGSGCFIGSGAIILGGTTIGDNVIIGAGAVVSKDIPSSCFAAGAPAKVVHYFDNVLDG